MKQAWEDLKSFVTIAMIVLLFVIVIANLFGAVLSETILVLVTNLVTAVFTYYFSKNKTDVNTENKEEQFTEEDNVIIENVEFNEELYNKNISENDFSGSETDGIGDDDNADN